MNYNITSTNGMKTSIWGPKAWDFLFISILGTYPIKIDKNNNNHSKIRRAFKNTLLGLAYTMPCSFCRDSFKIFNKQLPIDNYLDGKLNLFNWLYQIKIMVNNKLIEQELQCFNNEKNKLLEILNNKKINKIEYLSQLKKIKNNIIKTKSSPSINIILNKYEKYRATCSIKNKTCK
jgi:hypothetical protein